MSIAVLTQVYNEMRRLAIAGSVVAGGDFRLKKLIPPLEQAGAKAPVFAKVGEAVKTLVESNEKTSSVALLDLCTLVNAILYTQGETGLAGTIKPIETTDLGLQTTQASARVLKPLLEALSTTGSGRLEIIRDSFERGAFRDLRLVKPALQAIDDSYPEIGEFVTAKVLPLFGKAILPELRAKFDLKGKGGHVRRLVLMHKLDPEGTRETVKQALDDGSKEIKVAAIECLGDSPDDLSYLLEQSKAKAKDVRAAALSALSSIDVDDALEALKKALAGADLDLAVNPLIRNRNPKLLKFIIDESEKSLAAAQAANDKKDAGKQTERLFKLSFALARRDDKVTESHLLKMFDLRDKLTSLKCEPSGQDINEQIAKLMAEASKKCRQTLVNAHGTLPAEILNTAFEAAVNSMTPAEVYDMFAPYLLSKIDEKKKGKDPAVAKRAAISEAISSPWHWRRDDEEIDQDPIKWDPRWLDAAVKIKDFTLIEVLARSDHPECLTILSETFETRHKKSKDLHDCHDILATMIRIQHHGATDAVIATLKKHGGSKLTWGVYWIGRLIPDLPATAIEPLEALLPTLNEKVIDDLMGYVLTLKTKAAAADGNSKSE